MNASDISIIVPVHNGGANWARCLKALSKANPAPLEVLIVDDGSTDDSRQQAERYGWRVLQTARARSGPGNARNLGVERARGQVVFFVDADVEIYPDTVAKVAQALSDPAVTAVFGSYDDEPGDSGFFSQYKNLLHHYVHQNSSEDATSFWAGCGAVRREAFMQIGGFSPIYCWPSVEDIELGYRLRGAGNRIRLVKDLNVKHLKRWTARDLLRSDVLDRAIPWADLLLSRRSLPADLNLKLSQRVSTVLSLVFGVSIVAALFYPASLLMTFLAAAIILALNRDLYVFYWTRRGFWFALACIPVHWFYFQYSGVTLAAVAILRLFRRPVLRACEDAPAVQAPNQAASES